MIRTLRSIFHSRLLSVLTCTLLLAGLISVHHPLFSQQSPTEQFDQGADEDAPIPLPPIIAQVGVILLLALLPFFVMLLTSFLKIVVVLALLRNALGVQQAPPNQVINGMALLLTVYVMFPTGTAMYEKSKHLLSSAPSELLSSEAADFTVALISEAKEPMREFLAKNTKTKNEQNFLRLAKKYFPESVRAEMTRTDFIVLVPAYITSQVEDAFQIGVLIYLPFFVIDLVVSNVLLAMGMMMLSPMTIALPIKLLLLVMLDGWTLLVTGLVSTFKP